MKAWIFTLVTIFSTGFADAQNHPFQTSDIANIFREELFQYEVISLKWEMKGKAQAYFNEGLNSIEERNVERAIENFSEALSFDTVTWEAYFYRAKCYRIIGDHRKALFDLKQALRLNAHEPAIILELGKSHQILRDYTNAKEYYDKYIKSDAHNARGHYWMGNCLLEQQKTTEARQYYERCIKLDSTQVGAYVRLGVLSFQNSQGGNLHLKYLEKALKIDPLYKEALLWHSFFIRRSDPTQSISDLSKLIQLEPLNSFYRVLRAHDYIDAKDYYSAFSDLSHFFQDNQVNEFSFQGQQTNLDKWIDLQYAGYYTKTKIYALPEREADEVRRSYCLLAMGNYPEAIAVLTGIDGSNDSALCQFLLGIANEHQQIHEKAWSYYRKAVELDDTIIDAHKKVGIYQSNVQAWSAAEQSFSKAISFNPALFNVYKFRGVTRFEQRRYEAAFEDFQEYLKHDSSDIEAIQNQIATCTMLSKFDDAVKLLLRLPKDRALDYFKAMVQLRLKERGADAMLVYIRTFAAKIHHKDAVIQLLSLESDILMTQKKWDDAIIRLDEALSLIEDTPFSDDFHANLLAAKGACLAHKLLFEEAERYLKQANRRAPNNAYVYYEFGNFYKLQGDKKNAKKNFNKANELGFVESKI